MRSWKAKWIIALTITFAGSAGISLSPGQSISPVDDSNSILPLRQRAAVMNDWLRWRLTQQTARSRSRAAARRVQQHLKRAEQACKESELTTFFSELSAAIQEQLNQRLDLRVEGMTRNELSQAMDAHGLRADLQQRVEEELDNCDFGRFARSATDLPTRRA